MSIDQGWCRSARNLTLLSSAALLLCAEPCLSAEDIVSVTCFKDTLASCIASYKRHGTVNINPPPPARCWDDNLYTFARNSSPSEQNCWNVPRENRGDCLGVCTPANEKIAVKCEAATRTKCKRTLATSEELRSLEKKMYALVCQNAVALTATLKSNDTSTAQAKTAKSQGAWPDKDKRRAYSTGLATDGKEQNYITLINDSEFQISSKNGTVLGTAKSRGDSSIVFEKHANGTTQTGWFKYGGKLVLWDDGTFWHETEKMSELSSEASGKMRNWANSVLPYVVAADSTFRCINPDETRSYFREIDPLTTKVLDAIVSENNKLSHPNEDKDNFALILNGGKLLLWKNGHWWFQWGLSPEEL